MCQLVPLPWATRTPRSALAFRRSNPYNRMQSTSSALLTTAPCQNDHPDRETEANINLSLQNRMEKGRQREKDKRARNPQQMALGRTTL